MIIIGIRTRMEIGETNTMITGMFLIRIAMRVMSQKRTRIRHDMQVPHFGIPGHTSGGRRADLYVYLDKFS